MFFYFLGSNLARRKQARRDLSGWVYSGLHASQGADANQRSGSADSEVSFCSTC